MPGSSQVRTHAGRRAFAARPVRSSTSRPSGPPRPAFSSDARHFAMKACGITANIFVMVDEAHRTQYQSLAANMRQALPNVCFLGFTGTPIDKKDRSTLQTFGPYIDTYTIEQAVQDRATVPIFYESRLPELQIIGQTIDQAAAPRRRHRRRYGGVPRRRHRGPRQGAQRPMTAPETSAITWGETQVAYTIRRSARRKKTVAVTVDPTGGVLLVAPEHFATSRLDAVVRRKAAWIVLRLRRVQSHDSPLSPREFVSGESVLYLGRHYRLNSPGTRSCAAAGSMCPRRRERCRRPMCEPPSSRGSAVTRRSGCRSGWKRGGRRPASQCPPSSSRTSRNGGEAVTEPEPSA